MTVRSYSFFGQGNRFFGEPDPAVKPGEVIFTPEQQDKINTLLAEEKRKHQTKLTEFQSQLDQFKGKADETQALKVKLKEVTDGFLTKEQIAQQKLDAAKAEAENALKESTDKAHKWEQKFKSTFSKNEVIRAAAENKAYSAEQIFDLIETKIVIKETTDDTGNPTGNFHIVLPTRMKGKDGTETVAELPLVDAMKKMRENPTYGNLFLVEGKSGTGTTTINNSPNTPVSNDPPSDPESYRAWRANKGYGRK